MNLQLRNTLTGQTEVFKPLRANKVSIYCCGVTVYDLCHLGHARSYIIWDVLRRHLIWTGYQVTFVQNFTDIDDKILQRAAENNLTMAEVSEKNIKEFHKDMDALGILRPDVMPRATQCLSEIRSMITHLESKGAAYSVDGDVYFSVKKHANYGNLSGRDISEQQLNAGGRVSKQEEARKKNPFDFALWKGAKVNEPSFKSPWGNGRPGWHIECSAMVLKELGETIDIHLGGADLIFPHHENEIAQSELATGKKLATFWLHNGMVNVGGQKMSKSLGNFTTIRALLEQGVSAMTMRLFILQAHYRKPLDFTKEALNAASSGWKGLNKAISFGLVHGEKLNWKREHTQGENKSDILRSVQEVCNKARQCFTDALNDDLNTSAALAVLFEIARPLKSLASQIENATFTEFSKEETEGLHLRWETLYELSGVLGLKEEATEKVSLLSVESMQPAEIKALIEKRKEAKKAKDFEEADEIRQQLKSKGIELIDKAGGLTDWKRI